MRRSTACAAHRLAPTAEAADELAATGRRALDRVDDRLRVRAGRELRRRAKPVQVEPVAVRTAWRAGRRPPRLARRVAALARTGGKPGGRDAADARRHAVHRPVHEAAGVGVDDEQRELLRAGRDATEAERRAVARPRQVNRAGIGPFAVNAGLVTVRPRPLPAGGTLCTLFAPPQPAR